MKKIYNAPECEVLVIETADIITASKDIDISDDQTNQINLPGLVFN